MPSKIECALMAGASYISSRPDANKLPVPDGWTEAVDDRENGPSGFEATYFTKGTEVVISFAGTQPGTADWIHGNIPLANGALSDQLRDAADYYLMVKASLPAGTQITLTGHSLGGGLAALIAVMFGETAVTFDQAPFQNSAWFYDTTDADGLPAMRSVAQDLRAYLADHASAAELLRLDAYIAAGDRFNANPIAADTYAGRAANVTDINVQGEVLSYLGYSRIGQTAQSDISNSNSGASAVDLHSIALLSAFLQSDQKAITVADVRQNLNQVTFKLTDLLKMIFDKDLYSFDTTKPDENFLERLVKHEAGVRDANGTTILATDAMVTRFTRDLWKIAQDGGLTMNDANADNPSLHKVSDALIAFAMQKYYEEKESSLGYSKELFTKLTGGLQFDITDVSEKFKNAYDAHQADPAKVITLSDLGEAKGYKQYFQDYIANNDFSAEERGLINTFLPYMHDWYVQAGTDAMIATDTKNLGAFMLGGSGADQMTGGTADDLLVGNAGDDVLDGGAGNDIVLGGAGNDKLQGGIGIDLLLGGKDNDILDGGAGNDLLKGGDGYDSYAFTGDYGTDIITDSDGSGWIKVDEQALGSATLTFESIYKDTNSGQTIVRLNGGNSLVILKEGSANRILVNDWSTAKALGITLQDTAPIVPQATLVGDFQKATDGNNYVIANGNYVSAGEEADALDLISGTAGNDVIDGKGGAANDYTYDQHRRAA